MQTLTENTGYRQLPSSSESSLQSQNNCISKSDSNSSQRSDSPFIDCQTIDGKMNESKYSKVIFNEISESYATDADIECRFYIGDAVVASDEDKIGLFRVGWTHALEVLAIKKVSDCLTDNEFGEKKVRFSAAELPKSNEEFFQFCYLTSNDDICGASTPFRVVRPHDEDLIQLDNKNSDEEDFVVVRSQQALQEERVQRLVNENGVLEYTKRSLEQQINSKSNEISELRKINVEIEDKLKITQMESNRVMEKLRASEEQNRSDAEKIETLEMNFMKIINENEKRVDLLQKEIHGLRDAITEYEIKDTQNQSLLRSRNQDFENLIRKTGEQQMRIDELSSEKAMVEAKLELSSTSIAKILSERRDVETENRLLRNELDDCKAKCDSLDSKTGLMMSEILDFEKIKLKSKVQIKTMSEELEEVKRQMIEAVDTQKSMSNEFKQKEEKFEKQIEEMKLRLANAAEEYQKIYKYNAKLENRIDKIKTKVKKYFETKSQTKSATNVSETERHELMARAETEVKTVIENESPPDPSDVPVLGAASAEETTESIQINPMPCIICNEEITCISRDSKPMIQHLEERHSQRLCPVCSTPFDLTLPGHSNYFQMHVDNHFNPRYPEPTAPQPMIP